MNWAVDSQVSICNQKQQRHHQKALSCNLFQVIRHYHGHLSAVYTLALHPNIDVLVTAGRDATCRVWDMRTKANVHTLTGHTNTVASVVCQAAEPQVSLC